MSKSFEELLLKVKECRKKKVAVAVAQDEPVLEAIREAKERGIADAILVGDEAKIKEIADSKLNLHDVMEQEEEAEKYLYQLLEEEKICMEKL